jgi:RecA-family ATPase
MIENNESISQVRSVPPELEAVLRRKGYILLVKGDAGTGKTNLALELMALLHSEGDAVHISTRTYPEKLSFQPLIRKIEALLES